MVSEKGKEMTRVNSPRLSTHTHTHLHAEAIAYNPNFEQIRLCERRLLDGAPLLLHTRSTRTTMNH